MVPVGRRSVVAVVALACALAWAHAGGLDNSFHYDDIHSVVDNPHIRHLDDPARFLTERSTFSGRSERAMFRPLVVASYALTYAVAGLQPWAHLAVNLVAHLLCVGLVAGLAGALGAPAVAAVGAAALFGVHPLTSEVVNYVSSRSESIAAAGVLASALIWFRWRRTGGVGRLAASVLAWIPALMAKATAVILVPWLVVVEMLRGPAAMLRRERRWLGLVPFVALLAGYLAVVSSLAGKALGDPVRSLAAQLWTQCKALPYYLKLWVVPHGLTVEHDFAVSTTPVDLTVLASAALVASAAAVVVALGGWRARLLGAWGLLALAPASLVPLHVLVNEHRLYLTTACLAVGAALLWPRLRRLRPALPVALVLVVILATLSRERARVWDDDLTLWGEAVQRSPFAYRAHMHLGGALEARGDLVAALDRYRRAVELAPAAAEAHYNLGNALIALERRPEARRAWERALELNADFLDARLNLSAWYQEGGDWQRAWAHLTEARDRFPTSAEVWRRMGVARLAVGDQESAEQAYQQALRLDPGHAEAHYNLGNLRYQQGRIADAQRLYREALQRNADHHGAAYNLGHLLLERGQAAAVEELCRASLGRDSLRHTDGRFKFFYLLARALDTQGKQREALINYRLFLQSRAAPAATLQQVQSRIHELEAAAR